MKTIDLKNLKEVCRGDQTRMLSYLKQFQGLIPDRIQAIQHALRHNERLALRTMIHKMSPQIEFFGITEIVSLKNRLDLNYESLAQEELEGMINQLLHSLETALQEVQDAVTTLNKKP